MKKQNVKRCLKCQSIYPASDDSCPSCTETDEDTLIISASFSTGATCEETPSAGYIYVLINPSMEGIFKIGRTARNPEDRARELSSNTGVPTPFMVAYQKYFQDCAKAEEYIHSRLHNMNHKVSNNREFFNAPLNVAIDIILETWNHFGQQSQNEIPMQGENEVAKSTAANPWDFDFELAKAYRDGDGDTLQDYNKAVKHYLKSANLGSHEAFYELGQMYEYGQGVEENIEKAFSYYREGAEKGSANACVSLADIYSQQGHSDNARKCWSLLFRCPLFRYDKATNTYILDRERESYFLHYLKSYRNIKNIPPEHLALLGPLKHQLLTVAYDYGYD